jgi:hypothetical protein
MSLFIHGLTLSLKAFVNAKCPENINKAIDYARSGDSIEAMQPRPTVNAVEAQAPVWSEMVAAITDLHKEIRELKTSRDSDRSRSTCRFCQKAGHSMRECYTKKWLDRERLCYQCHQPHHVARDC